MKAEDDTIMNIDEKLKDILSWLNKHDLGKEAEELETLLKEASDLEPETEPDQSSAE